MFQLLTRPANGPTFTTRIDEAEHTYPSDTDGKRQAILDGLSAIPTITIGQDVYLPSQAAMEVLAAFLYPDGIQTAEAYEKVRAKTENACATLGYGAEVELTPPQVSFTARGSYRKKFPLVDTEQVLRWLGDADTNSYKPQQEITASLVWNDAAWELYHHAFGSLTPIQQEQIRRQVTAVAEADGWQVETAGSRVTYTKTLLPNLVQAEANLMSYIQRQQGTPLGIGAVLLELQRGAYGRAFYGKDLAPELTAVLQRVLQTHHYQTEAVDLEYRPLLLVIPPDTLPSLVAALHSLTPVPTTQGPALLWNSVLETVKEITAVSHLSQWQAEQLLQTGPVAHTLQQMGFRCQVAWCSPHQFTPALGDEATHQVLYKEVRVHQDPDKTIRLADGLPVYTPALVVDDDEKTLVYLEMVGHKQAVKANWAALMNGSRQLHYLGGCYIRQEGMKQHIHLKSSLPCGWANHILLHKQTSLKTMNPEHPFYLLDDGTQPIPPLFYAMLNKCLALPLLESWSSHLWASGREQKLITLLGEGTGQGYAAWRVLPDPETWQKVVQQGLKTQEICF